MKDKPKLILEMSLENIDESADCDIIGLNISTNDEAKRLKTLSFKKPIMVKSSDTDILLEVLKNLKQEAIIGIVDENNYKVIVPEIIKGGHTAIIRTPIDINLAKEMNILTSDMGLQKILIDTDIGGLGYGFEYGYSIMEKIKLENDKYLNFPLISFASEETAKTKEAKDENLSLYLEIASTSAVMACGADYIVFTKEKALKALRRLL